MDTKILNLNKLFINISSKSGSKNNDKSADNKSNTKQIYFKNSQKNLKTNELFNQLLYNRSKIKSPKKIEIKRQQKPNKTIFSKKETLSL